MFFEAIWSLLTKYFTCTHFKVVSISLKQMFWENLQPLHYELKRMELVNCIYLTNCFEAKPNVKLAS